MCVGEGSERAGGNKNVDRDSAKPWGGGRRGRGWGVGECKRVRGEEGCPYSLSRVRCAGRLAVFVPSAPSVLIGRSDACCLALLRIQP